MNYELLVILGPIIGVLAGTVGTVFVTWINKHYDEQNAYRKLIIETSMEYFKEALVASREALRGTGKKGYVWPYESFVISISHLVNKVVSKNFKIDDIDEIVAENKRLVETLEKSYSEINKKK